MKKPNYPIIDCHCHIGSYLQAEDLIKLMDTAGVDKAVVFCHPYLWTYPRKDNYHNTNDYIADMQEKYPERLIGFACLNPQQAGDSELGIPNLAVMELRRCIEERGLRGLKIHPENHCFAVDSLVGSQFMETIEELQKKLKRPVPILSHGMTTMGATPDQFGKVAARHPDISIIIAHGAGFQNLYFPSINPVKENPNLFVDTAMTTIDDTRLTGVAQTVGIDKIIFGSDHFTRNHVNLYGNFFYVLERAFPDTADRERIFGGNAAKLLGLA
jgi:predicted TIM-barrel fold metal-dependent hydrolase